MWTVYDTRVAYEQAIAAYDNKIEEITEKAARRISDRTRRSATSARLRRSIGLRSTA